MRAADIARAGGSGLRIGTGSSLLASEDFMTRADAEEKRILLGGSLRVKRAGQQADLIKQSGAADLEVGKLRSQSILLDGVTNFGRNVDNFGRTLTNFTSSVRSFGSSPSTSPLASLF